MKYVITRFLRKKSEESNPVSRFQSSIKEDCSSPPRQRVVVNLPKLTLKTFGGDSLEWLTFWDGFSSAIDKNSDLSKIDKMNYLSGLLKGEAARVISGLPLSNVNYSRAVELLQKRYGRSQTLVNSYMDALVKIPAPTSDVRKLRSFYDSCESYIRGLEALDTKTDSYGNLLIPILLKKLPEEIRRLIFRSNKSADSSLDELRAAKYAING